MKINNTIKRILCLALCLCMTAGMLLLATSCFEKEKETTDSGEEILEEQEDNEVAVLKVKQEIAPGEQITAENVGIGYASEDDIPINAVRSLDKIIDQYTKTTLYPGEFLFQAKLSSTKPSTNTEVASGADNFIIVKDYVEEGKDATTAIQNLIDKNPGKTLYFPDGTYTISKSLITPADPAKAVSLRFSNYAKLVASSSWSGSTAMICLGAGAKSTASTFTPSDIYVTGGIINGNGKAKAISVDGGRSIRIHDVSIKGATVGITIATGELDVDIDNVDITGSSATSATGMIINGSNNGVTNTRIYNVKNGVELGADAYGNTLMDVHAIYSGTDTGSYGFFDNANSHHTPNTFVMCTSENFATGFRMGSSAVSIFEECNAYWTKALGQQFAFKSDAKFNGVINGCKAVFYSKTSTGYLKATTGGGTGKITYPIIEGNSLQNVTDYSGYVVSNLGIYF